VLHLDHRPLARLIRRIEALRHDAFVILLDDRREQRFATASAIPSPFFSHPSG
jgi:hypothetical protein